MALTRLDKTGDGDTTVYDVDFDLGFISRSHVYVYLADTIYTDQLEYTWVNSTQIQILPPVDSGVEFHIRRVVPREDLVNNYTEGAILRESELDNSFKQSLMILQEIEDGYITADDTFEILTDLFVDGDATVTGELEVSGDAQFGRIINLPKPLTASEPARLQDIPLINGDSIAVPSVKEDVVLADGQTVVNFTDYQTSGAAFVITGNDVDNGTLLESAYTITSDTSITLSDSYPAGTVLTLALNTAHGEVSDASLLDVNQTSDVPTVDTYKGIGAILPIGKRIYLKDRQAHFEVVSGTGTSNDDDIIASDTVPQSIQILVNGGIQATNVGKGLGVGQTNLEEFRAVFNGERHNINCTYPGMAAINNPLDGSVFDFANFGGQDVAGFNPIGFVFHHYTDSRMIQIDNVGSDNEILYLKNANNSVRRPDQASDFVGDGKFISLNRQESDGSGGVTGTLEGFYISKDFEMVWPMQATGVNTVTLWNNVGAGSSVWAHVLKNSNEQQYLLSVDNDGTRPFKVEWVSGASTTVVSGHAGLQVEAESGDLTLKASGQVKLNQVLALKIYASSTLPTLTTTERGSIAYVDDGGGAGNRFPAHWDGTNWLRFSDNTIV